MSKEAVVVFGFLVCVAGAFAQPGISAKEYLETQAQAAAKVAMLAESTPSILGSRTLLEAEEEARRHAKDNEIVSIRSGNPDLVSPDDMSGCLVERERQDTLAAAKLADDERKRAETDKADKERQEKESAARMEATEVERQRQIRLHHCPKDIHISTSEACVYLVMGRPNRTNEDFRSGKQLVYPDSTYIYIDLHGRVENIQQSY